MLVAIGDTNMIKAQPLFSGSFYSQRGNKSGTNIAVTQGTRYYEAGQNFHHFSVGEVIMTPYHVLNQIKKFPVFLIGHHLASYLNLCFTII